MSDSNWVDGQPMPDDWKPPQMGLGSRQAPTGEPTALCSVMPCRLPARWAVQVTLPHGMGHALCCNEHGPHPGDRNGVVSVQSYLDFTTSTGGT